LQPKRQRGEPRNRRVLSEFEIEGGRPTQQPLLEILMIVDFKCKPCVEWRSTVAGACAVVLRSS